jgi:multidrug resistance efflux pump
MLAWIALGLIALYGIWVAFIDWYEHRETDDAEFTGYPWR